MFARTKPFGLARQVKEGIKSFFRKVVHHSSPPEVTHHTVIANGDDSGCDADSSLAKASESSPAPTPSASFQTAPMSNSMVQYSSSGAYLIHGDPEMGLQWTEPLSTISESDWQTISDNATCDDEGSANKALKLTHCGANQNINFPSSDAGQLHTSSIPSVYLTSPDDVSVRLDLEDLADEPSPSRPAGGFVLGNPHTLTDPFIEQPHVKVEQSSTKTHRKLPTETRPWDDFSEDEFDNANAPVYLGNGVYQLANGSQHEIKELPPREGEYYSPPNRDSASMLREIPESPMPPLLETRLTPEEAMVQAEQACKGQPPEVCLAFEGLVDQALVYYHNAEVHSRRAQSAEAKEAMLSTILLERDAEIERLRALLASPEHLTPPRPERHQSM